MCATAFDSSGVPAAYLVLGAAARGAGRFALVNGRPDPRGPCLLENEAHCCLELGMLKLLGDAEVAGKVVGADEEAVNVRNLPDFVQIVDRG